jgi:hypothetical protein
MKYMKHGVCVCVCVCVFHQVLVHTNTHTNTHTHTHTHTHTRVISYWKKLILYKEKKENNSVCFVRNSYRLDD